MNTRTTLLRSIALRRFDRLPRLAFADYLEEQCTDADTLTAEFIRVGVALAEGVDHHPPKVWCDCERCKLVRRQAELFDAMANTSLLTDSGYRPSGIEGGFTPANYAGGFPVSVNARWGFSDLTGMPLAVGRLFLCLPMTHTAVEFHGISGRPVRRETWSVVVRVLTATGCRGGRVAATVGPVVGQNYHPAFECEYPVDHACRVPTLVRKAVRRCLTNRTRDSQHMGTVPANPPPPARLVPAVHPVMRRRGRR